ncbi:ImmA/IrrE family metallo-endopeptidase [Wansuia hejianensis]|uniref:ImmA/IrrE family metallo-endopeptidase n=1 Tax=Wansuia hejianensis TaxID=2763667 RepID=A0A926IHG6_9FIRM|nr:ImmA/IrrE family metallo-endopeptidase [Wansuia hejianensis]MBC8590652.1 ImmA/IrrE family metallo-endopeptidase [Wansuia hejianensis]
MSNDIKDIVLGLKDLYDTSNPFELCKCLDITVLIHDLGDELLGFFQRTKNDIEILHINSRLNDYERKYICSHELGHAILQPDLAISFFIENPLLIKNRFEIEADTFTAELLLEDDIIEQYEGYTIEQIALSEKVPTRIIELKFKCLGLF